MIGGLTGSPEDLPLGWDGSNDGPGFIAPQTFEGLVMTLDEDAVMVALAEGLLTASEVEAMFPQKETFALTAEKDKS